MGRTIRVIVNAKWADAGPQSSKPTPGLFRPMFFWAQRLMAFDMCGKLMSSSVRGCGFC